LFNNQDESYQITISLSIISLTLFRADCLIILLKLLAQLPQQKSKPLERTGFSDFMPQSLHDLPFEAFSMPQTRHLIHITSCTFSSRANW
jgi:hypothetical protein